MARQTTAKAIAKNVFINHQRKSEVRKIFLIKFFPAEIFDRKNIFPKMGIHWANDTSIEST